MSVRPMFLTLTFVALTACSAAPGTVDAAPMSSPAASIPEQVSGDWILYQRDGRERAEVTVIHPDGSGLRSPLEGLAGGDQTNPDWDPSGTRFTFVMSDGDSDDLWVAGVDGSDATKLLDCVSPCLWIDDPSWSPDGDRIVYSRTVEKGGRGASTLETVEVDSGGTTVVLGPSTRTFTAGARWSPNGRRVVFEQVHKVGSAAEADVDGVVLSIVRMDDPDRPVRRLTDPDLYAATADWSPDGRRIVYSALATPDVTEPDLFMIAPRGGTPIRVTRLARRGGFAAEPTFTPDGSRIVFSGRIDSPGASLLLTVAETGGRVHSATGDVQTSGRHPRVRP